MMHSSNPSDFHFSGIRLSGEKIPTHQYKLFRQILADCNGQIGYVYTYDDYSNVSFSFTSAEDCNDYRRQWEMVTTPIIETRRDSQWRCLLRRCGLGFVERRLK